MDLDDDELKATRKLNGVDKESIYENKYKNIKYFIENLIKKLDIKKIKINDFLDIECRKTSKERNYWIEREKISSLQTLNMITDELKKILE